MAHDIQAAIRIEAASALMGASAARTGLASHSERQASAGGSAVGDDLAALSAGLPVYAGEVDTARADNRLGLPLGAAYLREASGLLRGSLLPVASDIYAEQSGLLTSASAQATGLPLMVVAIVIGLVIGYVFYRAWRWLTRCTHRRVNYGLLVAAVAGAVSLVWLAGAFAVGRTELLHALQQGSAPAETFAQADVAVLQAHADESLTLIDDSGDDSYQQDFIIQQKRLGPGPGTLLAAVQAPPGSGVSGSAAVAAAQAWYRAHAALRALDGPAPLGRRDLADTGREQVTITTGRARMSVAFAKVTAVVSAAEEAWNDMTARLGTVAADLYGIDPLGDEDLAAQVSAVRAEFDRLRDRAAAVAARSAELARLRDGARQRIDEVAAAAAAAAAHTAREDAVAACQRAAAAITAVPAVPADRLDVSARVAVLETLLAAGRWTRLSRSWICSSGNSRLPLVTAGIPNGSWLNSSTGAMSCAASSARTRRRLPAWVPPKIPSWPPGTTGPATCCGRRRAT